MRHLHVAVVIGLSLMWSGAALGQVPSSFGRQLGIEQAWTSQIQVPATGGVVSSHLWADSNQISKFAVVELPGQETIRVAAATLNRDGMPIGIDEAKVRASGLAARMLGRNDGFQVVEVEVPSIKLVMVSSDGLVQTLDAETGELLWASACGRSFAPAYPGAVSPLGVSVIHGKQLFLLDWNTGKHLKTKPLQYSTSNAVAMAGDTAFVSDFRGRVLGYGLGEEQRPWNYLMDGGSVGRAATMPNGKFTAIASDARQVYVFADEEVPAARTRYETSDAILGCLAAANEAFYVGSLSGLLAKISVENPVGIIRWEFRIGAGLTTAPLVVGENVLVASQSGDLALIDDKSGLSKWVQFGIGATRPIAMVGGKFFCMSSNGNVMVVDGNSGRILSQSSPTGSGHVITNQLTDRAYLISRSGQIQCLRARGASLPTLVAALPPQQAEESEEATQQPAPEAEASDDPFNFGGSGAASAEDPFGGSTTTEDPFDISGSGDPFGGGDPFGPDDGSF